MTTYSLEIDGSGAEQGAQRIVKSFADIQAAANRMEGGVSASARKASASFADLQKNVRPVSAQAIDTLKQLSNVFKGFRAPSDAAVRNTIIFLQGLKSVGSFNLGRVTGLANLLAAISGYRGPSPTSGKNTLSLLNALRFASSFSTPRGLSSTLTALSVFRGPSAAAARNVHSLLTALASFKGGPGLAASIRALNALSNAAMSARTHLNSLKGAAPSTINIRANTSSAQKGFNSLIKTQGILQTSLLRTQTAWNALGGVLAGRAIIGAANDIIEIRAQLQAATGSATKAAWAFDFLRSFSEKLGLEFISAARSFGFFLGSVKGTNLTLEESRQIFAGFSTAARALQLSTSDVDGVFRALGQMMSKGKIQAEELRGQLGDRLPGAFVRFAVALKMTKPGELDQALKKGAVSGEKMKQAIIDVANALEVEFAGSADKMSKTVEAAFNRLRNAFTFAASDLGQSGLNQGLINIMDTARKLIESPAFNSGMKAVGSAFKFLGDHINTVVKIIEILAISATVRWIGSLTLLSKAVAAMNVAWRTFLALQLAASLYSTVGAVGALSRAFKVLNTVVKANWVALLIAGLATLAVSFMGATKAAQDNANALDAVNAKMPDAANFSDAYAARLLNLADSANQVTASLHDMISKMNEAALRASQEDLAGLSTYSKVGSAFGYQLNVRSKTGSIVKGPGGEFTGADKKLLDQLTYRTPTGIALRGNIPQTKQEFEQLGAAMAMVDTRATGPGGENFAPLQSALHARFNALLSQSRQKGYKGLPYSDWAEQIVPGYNKPEGGISGGSPASTTKKKHGKSDAEKAMDDIKNAIEQAMKGLTDLDVEAKAAAENIDGLLNGSLDKYTAAAHAAAQSQEKTFEDSIKGPENKIKGVIMLARQLQGEGKIGADVDVSTYDRAKEAVINYMESLQKLNAERKRDLEVAENIAEMRDQNGIQQQAVDLLKLGVSQASVNKEIEIENQLLGTSVENRPRLRAELEKEIDDRERLRRALEITNAQRDLENQKSVDKELAPMYQSGTRSEDIDYYKEMLELRQKLIDDGYFGEQLRGMIAIHAASLNEARAMKEVQDQYERTRQAAQDMADAVVDGFRDGMQNGDSFLKTMKNIFQELKNIILDFVLYNPLRKWLADIFQKGLASSGLGGATASVGGANNYATPGGIVGGIVNTFSSALTGGSVGGPYGGLYQKPTASPNAMGIGVDASGAIYSVIGDAASSANDPSAPIVVTGSRLGQGIFSSGLDTNAPIPPPQQAKTTSFLQNFSATMKASQEGFKKFTQFLGGKGGVGAAEGIQGAIGAAGTAFAMYQMGNQIGSGVAKALGGGFRTQAVAGGILGGAAAGYSIGGPIGAAVGAVVGGVLGFLKKKPQIPSSYGAVTVNAQGLAQAGATGTHGNADPSIGKKMADAAASMFNNFIIEFGGKLVPGNFGSFGSREFNPPGPNNKQTYSFYSTMGVDSNGKPIGVEGQDWIKGSDSQVQAFALISQVRKGMIQGLTDTIKTVFANTKATDMESLQADLDIGKAYDAFIKGSFKLTDVAQKVRDLNETFNQLSKQAAALGLSEEKLMAARTRMMNEMKKEFNFQISQGILSISNPAQAAYNELVQEYHDAVEEAMAVGGNLSAVEKYYGMQRAQLAKQWADMATNGLVSAARDLYNQLTASTNSPLNAGTVLANSSDLYSGLVKELNAGKYENVDKLSGFAQNYLDAARNVYGSSTEYFDIFKAVTDTLNQFSNLTGAAGDASGPPSLPSLKSVVNEINKQSQDMIDAMGIVGQAVVEGSTSIVDAINNLAIALGYQAPGTTAPTTPTTSPTAGTGYIPKASTGGDPYTFTSASEYSYSSSQSTGMYYNRTGRTLTQIP